jgi:hypothetical protein
MKSRNEGDPIVGFRYGLLVSLVGWFLLWLGWRWWTR